MDSAGHDNIQEKADKPDLKLVAIATDVIMGMPLDVRVSVANLEEDELRVLEFTLGKYVQYKLDRIKNAGGREPAGADSSDEVYEVMGILRNFWQIL